ncbi:MAG: FAD-dependent oxidoreductase [Gammaproteobacteria bacterium]|nr:FAD-dependent oxidoreductase [Gammaproteobacteria bacterium]
MNHCGCIIIGGSHAAAQLAVSLRQEGWQEPITVISDASSLPYQRPPLSKGFLAQKVTADKLLIRPPALYETNQIDFRLQQVVSAVDPVNKQVTLANGECLAYSKLAFCTGARVRRIEICGADAKGIHYLRDLQDVVGLQQALTGSQQIVIVGGGYIGLETAASLRQLGHSVTVIEAAPRLLQRVTAPAVSEYFQRLHEANGVTIVTQKQVAEFVTAESGVVTQVLCTDGSTYPADLVIVGIGVRPNLELAQAAGLECADGIVVDEYARTADPDIVAAGDCAQHPLPYYDQLKRLESVPNAMEQAKVAAATLCGKSKPYQALPWFWSDQYQTKLQIAGLNSGYDKTVIRGDQTTHNFSVWYFHEQRLLAVDCINQPKDFMLAKALISQNKAIDQSQLSDLDFDLKTWL